VERIDVGCGAQKRLLHEIVRAVDVAGSERQRTWHHARLVKPAISSNPLSSGLSRAWSWPLAATVTLQSFSWTTFNHASQTASNQQGTVTRRTLKLLTKRPWEMSDIADVLETWEAATEAASRQRRSTSNVSLCPQTHS
jgi:hypothetical protein